MACPGATPGVPRAYTNFHTWPTLGQARERPCRATSSARGDGFLTWTRAGGAPRKIQSVGK